MYRPLSSGMERRIIARSIDQGETLWPRHCTPGTAKARASTTTTMPLNGIHHVELWVGNAAQAAYFFAQPSASRETAYLGLETGVRDRVSHVLEQGRMRLVLTGTLRPDYAIAEHHAPPRRRRAR